MLRKEESVPSRFQKQKQSKVSRKTSQSSCKIPWKKLGKSLCRAEEIENPANENVSTIRPTKSINALNILSPAITKKDFKWYTPQLKRKAISKEKSNGSRRTSQWTKLRLTLEFIRKSREQVNEEEDKNLTDIEPYKSLSFLGHLYNVGLEKMESDTSDETDEDNMKNKIC